MTQRKEQLSLVIIEGEEKWEVERILNKQQVRETDKYLGRKREFEEYKESNQRI